MTPFNYIWRLEAHKWACRLDWCDMSNTADQCSKIKWGPRKIRMRMASYNCRMIFLWTPFKAVHRFCVPAYVWRLSVLSRSRLTQLDNRIVLPWVSKFTSNNQRSEFPGKIIWYVIWNYQFFALQQSVCSPYVTTHWTTVKIRYEINLLFVCYLSRYQLSNCNNIEVKSVIKCSQCGQDYNLIDVYCILNVQYMLRWLSNNTKFTHLYNWIFTISQLHVKLWLIIFYL